MDLKVDESTIKKPKKFLQLFTGAYKEKPIELNFENDKNDYTVKFAKCDPHLVQPSENLKSIKIVENGKSLKRKKSRKESANELYTNNQSFAKFFQEIDVSPKEFWKINKQSKLSEIRIITDTKMDCKVKPFDPNFDLVTIQNWEQEINQNYNGIDKIMKWKYAGWIPHKNIVNMKNFSNAYPGCDVGIRKNFKSNVLITDQNIGDKVYLNNLNKWHNIFLEENEHLELIDQYDPNFFEKENNIDILDKDTIVNYLIDDNSKLLEARTAVPKVKMDSVEILKKRLDAKKEMRRSQVLLGKVGLLKETTSLVQNEEITNIKKIDKDPFNLSNDEYYHKKTFQAVNNFTDNTLQHAIPTVKLRQCIFPTHLNLSKLRNFQRPKLKNYQSGQMSKHSKIYVKSLKTLYKIYDERRKLELSHAGGGDSIFLRTLDDLSNKEGHLVLFEYCEQFPPFLNEIGMCSKIKNYFNKKRGKDNPEDHKNMFPFGELTYTHTSPFLGKLRDDQCLQTVENNMYRAPIFQHELQKTDFLIVRNKNSYYIRQNVYIFVVAQECPLMKVPSPNSKSANNFLRDFLQVYIYRQFWKSLDEPKKIKMDLVRKAFPLHSESILRKRLKCCADFKRTGTGVDSNWWILRKDFRLPSEDEILSLITPSEVCGYYSMIVAEQRLKDAGYGDKNLNSQLGETDKRKNQQDKTNTYNMSFDEDDDQIYQMETEIKCAPWNVTSAYTSAMRGRCLLSLTSVADPSGTGRCFSFTRIPIKPPTKDNMCNDPNKMVTGTDADLRKLPLKKAKDILRNYGIPENEISKLTRWEVIDVVRCISTNQVKTGKGDSKFARGHRFSMSENIQKYKNDAQRIFHRQNDILASKNPVPIDYSKEEEEDEKMGKQLEYELYGDPEEEKRNNIKKCLNKKLIIERTYLDDNGKKYTRSEIVRNPVVIEAYSKIRDSKNDDILRKFTTLDENQKEEMKKLRRRIQDQLRRIAKKEEKRKNKIIKKAKQSKENTTTSNPLKKKYGAVKATCSVCGLIGHMKTNKICPKKAPDMVKLEMQSKNMSNIDGIKMKIKLPKLLPEENEMTTKKIKKLETVKSNADYSKPPQSTNRRRTNPLVSMATIFEQILYSVRNVENSYPFHTSVNIKTVPDYYDIIKVPMDLQVIRTKIRQHEYKCREDFIMDMNLIATNSQIYNGKSGILTKIAEKMLERCCIGIGENESNLMKLEMEINPLLNEDRKYTLAFFLESKVVSLMRLVKNSGVFHHNVPAKMAKAYAAKIKNPMNLDILSKNIKLFKYKNRKQFIEAIDLIYTNSVTYNGPNSMYTHIAESVVDEGKRILIQHERFLDNVERDIKVFHESK
ncbi:hypothetical protein A3Q56_03685 [Intoshia linei]|uniref:Bromo domain-containing protein n=1 Tax=Intoshia linei TaxID=1819745 RepID=A0A177B2M7_9BILA|nr:hypothetical protein A3Q56_03685 [Intoshia linei]